MYNFTFYTQNIFVKICCNFPCNIYILLIMFSAVKHLNESYIYLKNNNGHFKSTNFEWNFDNVIRTGQVRALL